MKKFLSNQFFKTISVGLILIFAAGIINAWASKINLWESLLNLPVKIYHAKIPDFILAILIILIFIFLFLINKKFMGFSPDKIKEMKSDNEKLIQTAEDIELTENQLFILVLIAESDEVSNNSLFSIYETQFPEASQIEVKNIIIVLKMNGLIRHTGNIGGNRMYVALDKGIERASEESEIREKYRARIDEFIEMDKIAKKY